MDGRYKKCAKTPVVNKSITNVTITLTTKHVPHSFYAHKEAPVII